MLNRMSECVASMVTHRPCAVPLQVSDDPRVCVLDTPGVTLPNLKTDEIALRLAIIGEGRGGAPVAPHSCCSHAAILSQAGMV